MTQRSKAIAKALKVWRYIRDHAEDLYDDDAGWDLNLHIKKGAYRKLGLRPWKGDYPDHALYCPLCAIYLVLNNYCTGCPLAHEGTDEDGYEYTVDCEDMGQPFTMFVHADSIEEVEEAAKAMVKVLEDAQV